MNMFEVIIKAKTVAQLRALGKHGIDYKAHAGFQDEKDSLLRVDAIVSDDDINRLESEGYTVEKVSDLSDVARARLKEVSKTNRLSGMNTMSDLASLTVAGGYMNVDEIETELKVHNKVYPDLVELIELPNKTWEGKTSTAIRIHVGTRTNKPAVMFIGGVHAREWGTSDICMHFIRKLLFSYKSNSPLKYGNKIFTTEQLKTIVENIDIIVFPDVNPDGKAYSQKVNDPEDPDTGEIEGVWWRKNRNPNPVPNPHREGPEIHKHAGVDLNRNANFLWNSGIDTEEGGRPFAERYKGTAPFSEPESKNVKWLFDTYKNIKCFVDIHCHLGSILMSWGDDDIQCFYPEQNYRNPRYDGIRGRLCYEEEPKSYKEYMHPLDLTKLVYYATRMSDALRAVRGREYIAEPSTGLYQTSATNQDYAFSQRVEGDENRSRISAYTIEFGAPLGEGPEGSFIPEYSVMQNIMDDIASALTELCFAAASESNS
jgi:carboxypeptidase T